MNSSHQGFEGFTALTLEDPLSGPGRFAMVHKWSSGTRPSIKSHQIQKQHTVLNHVISIICWYQPCNCTHTHINHVFAPLNPVNLGDYIGLKQWWRCFYLFAWIPLNFLPGCTDSIPSWEWLRNNFEAFKPCHCRLHFFQHLKAILKLGPATGRGKPRIGPIN